MNAALSTNVARFCARLRAEHVDVGQAQVGDALRAMDLLGMSDRLRVQAALRAICCTTPGQVERFDRLFAEFFDAGTQGAARSLYAPRHTRPSDETPPASSERPANQRRPPLPDEPEAGEGGTVRERRVAEHQDETLDAWQTLRALYSPGPARAPALQIDAAAIAAQLTPAKRLVNSVRRGRSRRWRPQEHGGRLDLRRTIRASLQTGGDPVHLRHVGHPLRNPRFVVLIDGSASMAKHSAAVLHFAGALLLRSRRANVFSFSTQLREITRELRTAAIAGGAFPDLGEAWGGGTKLGECLAAFVRDFGARLLNANTVVIVASDGLDAGDVGALDRAMRELRRRCAAIVWLNPHLGSAGYAPTARGMRAALPYVAIFAGADAAGIAGITRRLAKLLS